MGRRRLSKLLARIAGVIREMIEPAGLGAIFYGIYLVNTPAAFVVTGFGLVIWAQGQRWKGGNK